MFDTIIENAIVVRPSTAEKLSIAITDGKIVAILDPTQSVSARQTFDFSGKIIFPGIIDSHSHVTYCGDIPDGSFVAASGGVTTLIEMPTSEWLPAVMDKDVLKSRVEKINLNSAVDFALWGGISAAHIEKVSELNAGGIAAFKVFLSNAGSYGSFSDGELQQLYRQVQPLNCLVGIHAETESICAIETAKLRKLGIGSEGNSTSRPIISEILAVTRLCELALHENARAHICHISSDKVVDVIDYYRGKGACLSSETCLHYLLLTDQDVIRCGSYAKCSPPIRSKETVDTLWEKVIHGGIDIIGSDHAIYTEAQKESGSFWDVPGGFPGLDLILSGLFSEGVLNRQMTLERLAEITALNTAKVFGLSHCKGSIEIGKDADLAVFDPAIKWTFHAADSFYNNPSPKYPYENRALYGKVTNTFVRGNLVFSNGTIIEPSTGRFIPAITNK